MVVGWLWNEPSWSLWGFGFKKGAICFIYLQCLNLLLYFYFSGHLDKESTPFCNHPAADRREKDNKTLSYNTGATANAKEENWKFTRDREMENQDDDNQMKVKYTSNMNMILEGRIRAINSWWMWKQENEKFKNSWPKTLERDTIAEALLLRNTKTAELHQKKS